MNGTSPARGENVLDRPSYLRRSNTTTVPHSEGTDNPERMNMSIILARHGQTEHNRDEKILGTIDSPLTRQGRDSASKLASVLTGLKPARAFSSPLGRARDTAGILSRDLGLEVEPREEMAELSAGEWEGLSRTEAVGTSTSIRHSWSFRPPGGESYLDGAARLVPFLKELRELPGTTLVVGHFAINRSFLKSWLDLGEDEILTINVPHEALYLIDGRDGVTWFDNRAQSGKGFLEWKK